MIIINKPMSINDIIQSEGKEFFSEDRMIKAVADLDKGLLAVNAPMHAELPTKSRKQILLSRKKPFVFLRFSRLFATFSP